MVSEHAIEIGSVDLSVVVPCYNEEGGIEELVRRVTVVCEAAFETSYEIILVNDGSTDATWSQIMKAVNAGRGVTGVNLARNHGHQLALTAGLHQSRGELIFILDADLQDPPELLPDMLKRIRDGYDVVYGQRVARHGEGVFKRATACIFYRLMGKIVEVDIPADTGDFRLMTRRVLAHLNAMPERYRFVRGMVSWLGYNQCALPYERDPRFAGSTHYPLRKMIAFALDAATSFSVLPLRFASYLGLLFALAGVLALGWVGYAYVVSGTVAGWTSLAALILVLGSIQLLILGVFGEYLGRMYMETKRRPLFLIKEIVALPVQSANPVHNLDQGLRARLSDVA
ncbi:MULTISPECIES: glycosyltransferase [unclassified Sphingobium]|uniref:glycosyltransferase n=1 Tax=unclassified Sphingobium TaxID=2611147 RepID=UPI002223FABB|nr:MULTISPECIES: glycosyltransferase [unclassified Sphingobium]MCW2396203.1 dolichol-phosphate mannosyltransferase [Sphingobium sp. B8D3B]MCW2419719.1 dolichol-phosphate mannosyltransferase [Sphingobium sp. B8D3C]